MKLSEEIVEKIKKIQQEENAIKAERGTLEFEKDRLAEIEKELKNLFSKNRERLKDLLEEVEAKYGKGSIDPQTWEFVPAEEGAE